MSNVLDFSTSNAQVVDEIINVSDANPVTIKHDTFYNKSGKAVLISTGPGGTGTVLVNPLDGASDYTPGDAYTFPEPYNTTLAGDVGYTTIAITNAAYHSTDLYLSYYPIWDLLYAARWNNNIIIPHYASSPYDISATTEEVDLSEFNSWPVGTTRRVHAYDGDGSDYLWFTDNGETINGMDITYFKIQGTGGLILTKVGDGEFIAKGWLGGDVFDQDGDKIADAGNLANQIFTKSLSGRAVYEGDVTFTAIAVNLGPSGGGYYSAEQTETLPLSPFSSIDTRALTSDGDQQVAGLYQGASMSTTVLGYHVRRVVSGGSVTRTMHFKVEGRWADDYPEAS